MFEVELKARVEDREVLLARLQGRATAVSKRYRDAYYDWPDQRLQSAGGQELRVRVIEQAGVSRTVLTYKAPMLDPLTTPEHETAVADQAALEAILGGLGLVVTVAYEKHCLDFAFRAHGHDLRATVVQVPELAGQTFVELEALVADQVQVPGAKAAVERCLADLGLDEQALDGELYMDRVRRLRDDSGG